ncbi:MAG: hypothetical protein AAFP09_05070, partial [Cyanobacteria bacterium J06607_10]
EQKGGTTREKLSSQELFVEISAIGRDHDNVVTYWAKLIRDNNQTVCVKASCDNAVATPIVKYAVAECAVVSAPQPVFAR